MIIRRAKPKDFLPIAALDRVAWGKNRNSKYIPDGEHAWRLWVEYAIVFCAEINSEIIGAILSFPCINGQFCVHKVFVREGHRGRGMGSKLFAILLREIDLLGVESFLTVDPANKNALILYQKWGFVDKKFVKGFYRQNEDRFVLTRKPKSNNCIDGNGEIGDVGKKHEKHAHSQVRT